MQKNKVLKALLAVSTVAAMFSTFGVQAQTSSTSSQGATTPTGQAMHDGTVGNTNSQGKDQRSGATTDQSSGSTSGSGGMSGATGTSGSMSGNTDAKGTGMSGQSGGSASASGSMSKADQKILTDMAYANIDEIEAGKLALSKTQDEHVKSFAQQMVDDHTKALADVTQVAQSKGVTLPSEPDAKHKAMASKLEKMSGAAFDKAYMAQAGVSDHKKVLGMLKTDQKRAKDADVKGLAEKMTPVVEQHLKAAQQTPVGAKSGTTSGK
jgi:putative membrane protein